MTINDLKKLPITRCPVSRYGCNTAIPNAVKYIKYSHLDWAEFGVSYGTSTKTLLNYLPELGTLHLFDSFEGLPEDWIDFNGRLRKKGTYAVNKIPDFHDPRTKYYIGLFESTIPYFVKKHSDPLAFIHVDCDIYSSTKDIFNNIDSLIIPGTIILFDDYYNYPTYFKHEYKAFMEYIENYNRKFKYLGRTKQYQAWVEICE